MALKKIKNDAAFIDSIFAAKKERENAENPDTKEERTTTLPSVASPDLKVEEGPTEKYEDVERIISEAEAAAFLEEENIIEGKETVKRN